MSPAEIAEARRAACAPAACGPAVTLDRLPDLRTAADGAVVTGLQGDPLVRERLAELGFTPGIPVSVISRAPNGGPLRVCIRGGFVALRREEAAQVRVHPQRAAATDGPHCAA